MAYVKTDCLSFGPGRTKLAAWGWGMRLYSCFFGVALLALVGCAKHGLIQQRLRTQAPRNAHDVGVLLNNVDSSQVEKILRQNSGARVRVIDSQSGLYEIFNVPLKVVRHEVTNGDVEKNVFFKLRRPSRFDALSFDAPDGLQVGDLNPCHTAANGGPTAVLTVDAPNGLKDGSTIELGQTVHIDAKKSQGAVKTAIVALLPESATPSQIIKEQSDFTYKPVDLGLHRLFLVVQDAQGACSLDVVRFIVTANRPYRGPKAEDVKIDLSQMKHLTEVSAEQSWRISRGAGITIAIVDTGVDYNHPSLAPNIAVNSKEIPNNGIDDDKNGFVDDVLGYDFVNSDAYPYDDDGHGTHVAGLAAARQFGEANQSHILAIKALNSIGGDIGSIAGAIRYAVDRGANIINLSLGSTVPLSHPTLAQALDYAQQKGVLVVAAAGNGDEATGLGYDIDVNPVYPASLGNDNLVAVAAFDQDDVLSTYSNFGARSVDVVAPGGSIQDPLLSAAFENKENDLLIKMAGTSMATPIVSGIAAQVWSANPKLSYDQVKQILIEAGPLEPTLKAVTVSGRHIDALQAVKLGAQTRPARPSF